MDGYLFFKSSCLQDLYALSDKSESYVIQSVLLCLDHLARGQVSLEKGNSLNHAYYD